MDHRPRICVVGSLNLDLVARLARLPQPGETIVARDARSVPGGKGANQAVAVARLGAEVQMIGCVGDDAFGKMLLDNLAAEKVDGSRVRVVADCSTGMAFINVDQTGENTIVVAAGANGRLTAGDVQSAKESIAAADLLLVQNEVPLETVQAAIDVARKAKVKVLFNPAPAPPVREITDALLKVDLLCLNQTEASAFTGKMIDQLGDAEAAARSLQARGAESVAITLGPRGALTLDAAGSLTRTLSFTVKAIDATAAGDAFVGALAVRLVEGATLPAAADFACAAGAIATTRFGAQPSLPRREEVESLLATIHSTHVR